MSLSTREQLWAFLALIFAIVLLGGAPILTSGILGKTMPDSLIAVSDKSVSGLIGVLGAISTLIFRSNRADEVKAETAGKMADAVVAAANSTPPGPIDATIVNSPSDPVPVESKP